MSRFLVQTPPGVCMFTQRRDAGKVYRPKHLLESMVKYVVYICFIPLKHFWFNPKKIL